MDNDSGVQVEMTLHFPQLENRAQYRELVGDSMPYDQSVMDFWAINLFLSQKLPRASADYGGWF